MMHSPQNTAFWQSARNPHTLGFKLDSRETLDFFMGQGKPAATEMTGMVSYIKALLQTLNNKQMSDHHQSDDQDRIIN